MDSFTGILFSKGTLLSDMAVKMKELLLVKNVCVCDNVRDIQKVWVVQERFRRSC